MEHQFKVGDKVTVFRTGNVPSAVRIIEKISPKRGDIYLKDYPTTFNKFGWSKGDHWNRQYIEPWSQKHSETITISNLQYKIGKFFEIRENREKLSMDELKEVVAVIEKHIEAD